MVLLEKIKRWGDNGKALLGEFLMEVTELVAQSSSRGSSAPGTLHTVDGWSLLFPWPGLNFSHFLPASWGKKNKPNKSGVLSRRSVGLCMQS